MSATSRPHEWGIVGRCEQCGVTAERAVDEDLNCFALPFFLGHRLPGAEHLFSVAAKSAEEARALLIEKHPGALF